MICALLLVVIALALAGAAVFLLKSAKGSEQAEEVRQRLHVATDIETVDGAARPRIRANDPVSRWIIELFWRAGADVKPAQVVTGLVVALIVAGLLVLLAGVWVGGLITAGALVVAYIILLRLGALRRQKITEQLPAFLENVIRVLAAGNTLEESFGAAAREASDPIRPLFVSLVRQVKLGAPVDEVLTEMGIAYRLRDLRVLGLAANVNRRYGGSIRAVLKSVITAIRQRSIAARELRALTGETRFSAMVLAFVPIALSLYIYSRNTQYYATMYEDPNGKFLLIASVALQVVGSFILWRMLSATEDVQS